MVQLDVWLNGTVNMTTRMDFYWVVGGHVQIAYAFLCSKWSSRLQIHMHWPHHFYRFIIQEKGSLPVGGAIIEVVKVNEWIILLSIPFISNPASMKFHQC